MHLSQIRVTCATMVAPQPPDSHQLTHDDRHDSALMNSIAPYPIGTATENHVHQTGRAESRAAPLPNPSTFYKTYLDPNIKLLADQDYFQPEDDGYTCASSVAATHSVSVDDAQPQASGHAAAYKLAAGLMNRSNGAPLATIIEQGSYSTLNSHGSLLSVGRFPSKAAETTSPIRASRWRSQSLDGKALQDIREDSGRESDTLAAAVPHARQDKDREAADLASGTATPLTSYRFERQRSSSSHSVKKMFDHDDRSVKGFIRGVFENLRGVGRARSRSSSLSYAPIVEHRDSPRSSSESKPQTNQQGQSVKVAHLPKPEHHASTYSSRDAVMPVATEDQTRSRITPSSSIELSAWAHPPWIPSRSDATKSGHDSSSIPYVSPCQTATCAHERPFSTPVVHAGTRDVAPGDGTAQASTSYHGMFDTSAQYTFDGIPIYSRHLSSDQETSSARDVFTKQNASFCSTMSTSYSGTVLGVDLDLQHDFTRPIRRSQSPPTPVWFTPQMAELERQAFLSDSPESVKACAGSQAPCHLIQSSALTSLLPIAAATGIVQPNYNTPTISFYSPSGNLIQPESSPSQCTSPSEYTSSPTITTSYYNKRNANAGASAGIGLSRPPLMPMTTPPTQRVPLPSHLRHHHNYRHPEISQISSRESYLTPKGPVRGCDGVVREDSLTPRSGVFFSHGKNRVHRSVKVAMHDLKAEVKFYKARFLAMAAAQSFAPSMPKRKTTQKRGLHDYDAYAKKPHIDHTKTREGRFGVDTLGPLAAHALRICFCQPYDGAGISTRPTAVRIFVAGEPFAENDNSKGDQPAKDAERLLPRARVIGSSRHGACGDPKRDSRRDSAFSSTTQRASYIETAKLKAQ